jgi:predicted amidohydrolase YtcJ
MEKAMSSLARMGLTGIHDFDRRRCFSALQILRQKGDLPLRVVKSIPLEDLPLATGLGLRTGFGDDYLRIGSVKAFADGALGPRTAAMIQPYKGEPSNRGMLLLDVEEMVEHGRQAVDGGLSLAVHAIGDRAIHEMLEAFSQIRAYEKARGLSPLPHRIEHVQLIHPQDASRLAELNLVASMQPIHAPSDMPMADRFWGERAAYAYAWRVQLDHGAVLAFGSDAPVESPNPFWGLHAAVTRRRADGSPGKDGWYPAQRLTLEQALRGFTTGAALAAASQNRQGQLAPGFYADLLVLEQDPFQVDADELRMMRPSAVMVGGNWTWYDLA